MNTSQYRHSTSAGRGRCKNVEVHTVTGAVWFACAAPSWTAQARPRMHFCVAERKACLLHCLSSSLASEHCLSFDPISAGPLVESLLTCIQFSMSPLMLITHKNSACLFLYNACILVFYCVNCSKALHWTCPMHWLLVARVSDTLSTFAALVIVRWPPSPAMNVTLYGVCSHACKIWWARCAKCLEDNYILNTFSLLRECFHWMFFSA